MERKRKPIADRLEARTDKSSECWVWTGGKDHGGYGQIKIDGKHQQAHRVAFQVYVGPLNGLWVLHKCDNPPCVRPSHLYLGTKDDNEADKMNRARQAKGERIFIAKLTDSDVMEIRRLRPTTLCRVLAARFGVTRCQISAVALGRYWKHLPLAEKGNSA